MPIVSHETQPLTALASGQLPDASSDPAPSTGSIFGAAFRQNNIVGSTVESAWNFGDIGNGVDPNYNAWNDIKGTPYEEHWQTFAQSNNREYTHALKAQLDKEQSDRRILESSGWTGTLANFSAALTDPTLLLPVGGEVRAGGKLGYVALRSARAGAVGSILQEGGLQASQVERPLEESALNVGMNTVLSGILGPAASTLLSKGERATAVKGLETFLHSDPQSVGAAAATKSLGKEALTVEPGAADKIAKATQNLSPNLRLNYSPSGVARQLGQELAEGSIYQAGHAEGLTVGPAVERLAGMTERARFADGVTRLQQTFSDMKKSGINMSWDDFNKSVGRAMRSEDAGENEFVSRGAKEMRSSVVDPFFEDGKAVGLYEDGDSVAFAPSYFPRQYRTKVLIAKEPEIKAKWVDYMTGHIQSRYQDAAEEFRAKIAHLERQEAERGMGDVEAGRKISAERAKVEREFFDQWEISHMGEGVDPLKASASPNFGEMAKSIVDEVYEKLTGRDYGASSSVSPEYMIPIERGPVKERTLPIPDWLLTEQGVLEDHASDVLKRYARVLSADTELTRRFGSPDLKDQLKDMADEYAKLRKGLTDPKELAALDKRQRADQRDIEALRDLIRGTYKREQNATTFARIMRTAGHFNFVRSLGGIIVGSLSDVARPAMVHGLTRYMGEGIAPLIHNFEAVNLSVKEAKLAGVVVDRALAHRMMAVSSLADPFERGNALDRTMEQMSRFASKWSGISWWNDTGKSISSMLSQNRILAGEVDRRTLAFLGIDPAMEDAIRAQFKAHGEVVDGVHVANTERWTDQNAIRAFRAAVGKDVDSTIVTPSIGDVPLLAHTPLGRMLLQFKSFTLASHQKVLLRGLQENKAKFVSGMVGMTALGTLSAFLKAWRAGENRWEKFKKAAENPGYVVGEGLDNSGLFTLAFDAANTSERLSQSAGFSFNPLKTPMMALGSEVNPGSSRQGESIRFSSRGPLSVLGGPTAGMAEDMFSASRAGVNAAQGKKVARSDRNAAIRLLPFNSFYGLHEAIQAVTGDSPYPGAVRKLNEDMNTRPAVSDD